jgi:transcriptional regulator GlxA family with amidase domain
MSARTLHRLFARHGLTVAAWIKNRWLEACRRALVSPGSQTVPINEIASRFGFPNQAFFSRGSPNSTARARADIGSATEADHPRAAPECARRPP